MNQLLSLSGANAPPVDWLSELSSPAKQDNLFGQPSFADIFMLQTAPTPVSPLPMEQAQTQGMNTERSYTERLRSTESDRYNYHSYEQSNESDSVDHSSTDHDPATDPNKAASAASAQVSSNPAEQSQEVKNGGENGGNEEGGSKKMVEGVTAAGESEKKDTKGVEQTVKNGRVIVDLKAVQLEKELNKAALTATVKESNDGKVDNQLGIKNNKSRSGTQENASTASILTPNQGQVHGKDLKPATDFSAVVSDTIAKSGEKTGQPTTKKGVKIETDLKTASEAQVKSEIHLAAKAENLTRTAASPRMAESRNLNPTEQIIKNVEVMVKGEQTSMRMQLHPEALGKIELRLMQTDSGMMVAMIPDEKATSTLLETQLAELRTAFSESGIQLSDVWVGQQEQAEQQGWWSEQSSRGRHNGKGFWQEEQAVPDMERQVNHSISGLDYLV